MEHPFAQYIQMLGKGRKGSRDLTQDEARQAMEMILAGQTEPVQLGAFLMLMRVKEETAAEVAGFVQAVRASLPQAAAPLAVDLDWASYAGKRRQLPWYVLSALLLASHDISVLMHGIGGGIAGRVFVPQALSALGISTSNSIEDAAARIKRTKFAFLPLEAISPALDGILALKPVLGLRSPVHTVIRMLNPALAPASILGIFHPGYDETHQQAAVLLGDPGMAVFKGEGGEAERNPDTECKVRLVRDGVAIDEDWPALFGSRHMKDEAMDVNRLAQLWRGEIEDEYGQAAVVATAAIALRAMGRAASREEAGVRASDLWQHRDKGFLDKARG